MLILLTGPQQAVPTERYEAARLDGANRPGRRSRRVTLPIMRLDGSRSCADPDGHRLAARLRPVLDPHPAAGPDNTTTSLVMAIYREASSSSLAPRLGRGDLGAAARCVLVVLNAVQLPARPAPPVALGERHAR